MASIKNFFSIGSATRDAFVKPVQTVGHLGGVAEGSVGFVGKTVRVVVWPFEKAFAGGARVAQGVGVVAAIPVALIAGGMAVNKLARHADRRNEPLDFALPSHEQIMHNQQLINAHPIDPASAQMINQQFNAMTAAQPNIMADSAQHDGLQEAAQRELA